MAKQNAGTANMTDNMADLLPEEPKVNFKQDHNGRIDATVRAKNRSTLTNPLIEKYVTQEAREKYGSVSVEAGSRTPTYPKEGEDEFQMTMRLYPAR